MENAVVTAVRSTLMQGKTATLVVEAPDGKSRLLLIPSNCIGGNPANPELLIVLENYGSIFYTPGMVLNVFKMLMSNFPINIAGEIVKLLNAVFSPPPLCRIRRLSAPKGA